MKVITGNIFRTEHQTIVNTVNCFGIMGAGLALECKYRYPEMFIRYKEMCDKKLLDIGKLYLFKTNQKWILNFPTKHHWKYDTKPEYLEKGLQKFKETYKERGITSVAFPLLGAQNGGLTKEQSLHLLEKYLIDIEIPIEIYHFDADASDDLFYKFSNAFHIQSNLELRKVSLLKEDKIKKIKDILENEGLKNMGQLASFKGIGETTIQKCFDFAMRIDTLNIQSNLF